MLDELQVHKACMMFLNSKGNGPSKKEMVDRWKQLFKKEVSGHSARRTGAMAYVRRGMSIRDLAYLGRWKSSVVLIYAGSTRVDTGQQGTETPRVSEDGAAQDTGKGHRQDASKTSCAS